MRLEDDGTLKVKGKHYTNLEVPHLHARINIVRHASGSLAFPDGDRLYQLLQQCFFWTGMQQDCLLVACSLVCTQKEHAHFKSQPYFYLTEKGAGPLLIWAIDSMVGLHSPHSDTGATSAVFATDCFRK